VHVAMLCVCVDGPIMSESYVKMAVDVHQSATLVCSVRGWPTPTMTWSRNSTSLTDSTKYEMTSHVDADGQFPDVSILNISDVQQDDLSIYSCTAHNDMGVSVMHFNVTVKCKSVLCTAHNDMDVSVMHFNVTVKCKSVLCTAHNDVGVSVMHFNVTVKCKSILSLLPSLLCVCCYTYKPAAARVSSETCSGFVQYKSRICTLKKDGLS